MKKRKEKNGYFNFQTVFLIFVICYIWIWAFYTTQPATEKNTYVCTTQIVDVEIHNRSSRGEYDEVHLKSKEQYFVLVTNWCDNDKTQALANRILSEESSFTLTVWEHFALTPFDTRNGKWKICQIANLCSGTENYWDVESFNYWQKNDRIIAMVVATLVSVIFLPLLFFASPFEIIEKCKKRMRKYKKKQKKAKQGGTENNH